MMSKKRWFRKDANDTRVFSNANLLRSIVI